MQSTIPLSPPQFGNDPAGLLTRPQVGMQRLLVGLLQGVGLYWLYRTGADHTWPATVLTLYIPLLLAMLLGPVVLVAGLGQLSRRRLLVWVLAAVLMVAALGWYSQWREVPFIVAPGTPLAPTMPGQLLMHLIAALFISHTLVTTATAEERRIASYGAYFDGAWKLAVQLVFSAAFIGAVMLVLHLGGALFTLIKLDFLKELLREAAFNIPVATLAFACAMHVTDVRPAIVHGIRNLLLVLMSWLLPVATLLIGGFLCSLPFTGLASLWAIHHAAAVLLGSAALLVVMINAAWQNGLGFPGNAAVPVRLAARVAAFLLIPLVALAVVALALRVRDYGWTDDRIVAAAISAVAACYALGYAWASLQSASLARLAGVNIATAFIVVGLTVALFSPLLDPARLSVNSQLARLGSGKVTVDKFDFNYLRFHGARYGREALAQLASQSTGANAAAVRAGATKAQTQQMDGPFQAQARKVLPENLVSWPSGRALPASFLSLVIDEKGPWMVPPCMITPGQRCDVFAVDFGSGKDDLLVIGPASYGAASVFQQGSDGAWHVVDVLSPKLASCAWFRERLMAGQFRTVIPSRRTLEVGGVAVPSEEVPMPPRPELACPPR